MAEIEESKITDITGGSELDKMDARAKAAVVVVSLGADRASQIYKYLSEQEIEDLTYEVAKLGKTNNAQVENALDEFYKMCLTHKMMTDGGLDYARSVLEKHLEKPQPEISWKKYPRLSSPSHLTFLQREIPNPFLPCSSMSDLR